VTDPNTTTENSDSKLKQKTQKIAEVSKCFIFFICFSATPKLILSSWEVLRGPAWARHLGQVDSSMVSMARRPKWMLWCGTAWKVPASLSIEPKYHHEPWHIHHGSMAHIPTDQSWNQALDPPNPKDETPKKPVSCSFQP